MNNYSLKDSGFKGLQIPGSVLGECLKVSEIFSKEVDPTLSNTEST